MLTQYYRIIIGDEEFVGKAANITSVRDYAYTVANIRVERMTAVEALEHLEKGGRVTNIDIDQET